MQAPAEIQTGRLELTRLRPEDAAELYFITGEPWVMQYWHPGPDPDVAAASSRIDQINAHWEEHGFGDWGVSLRETGQLVGFAGLHYVQGMPEVNLGYALHPCAWGKGLGFELCSRILEVAFVDLQLPEVIAVIDPRNTTSRRLAAKCGLHLWKHRKWKGLRRVVYRILRREYTHRIAEHAGA